MKQVLNTNFGGGNKKRKKIITFGENFELSDLMCKSHSVKLYDGSVYVNMGSGIFVDSRNIKNIRSPKYIYDSAKTVMDSSRHLIAKRLKVLPPKASVDYWKSLQKDPDFHGSDYQLRYVRVRFK
ncbi:hypothetical protein EQ500_09520 [Lactobacillus sp. XV13L]|nr:hypothetical protein [Lactobacillus sp. XV13L]